MEAFDVRVGDSWVFTTNYGGIERTITGADAPELGKKRRIYYRPYGDYHETSCLLSTFRRWWRCAELNYRHPDVTEKI